MVNVYIEEIWENDWTKIEGYSSTGKRVKCWLEKISTNQTFIYKEPKEFNVGKPNYYISLEIWTEYIAYKIGNYLGLNVPKAIPAKYMLEYPYKYGILIENFLTKSVELFEAKQLSYRIHHTLEDIKHFTEVDLNSWDDFKKMLVFDCLIGNNDRHDENWGFCLDKMNNSAYLSPIYDNASCLTRELNEQGVQDMLKDNNKFNKYIVGKNSRPPNLYINREYMLSKQKSTHYEIMKYLIDTEENMVRIIKNILDNNYIDYINDIIIGIRELDVPKEYRISEERHELIIRILEARYQKLKELL